jgi:phosphoribosylformylglycinamidine synthase
MALSVDGNPFYGEISPFDGAANAVAEAMRNVAAVGAQPRALTDCLNFGNPEVPEHFWQLEQGIQGLAEAAKNLYDPNDTEKSPIAFVSGNVSLYNHSSTGKSVPPSPIVACVGVIDDASRAVTMEIKSPGNKLLLVGERLNELGGSEYYRTLGLGLGANVPKVRYENERGIIYGTIVAVNAGLVCSTHDISHGGLLASAAEMLLAASPHQKTGLHIDLQTLHSDLREDILLFTESSGMLIEASPDKVDAIQQQYKTYGLEAVIIGETTAAQELTVQGKNGSSILKIETNQLRQAWRGEFGLTLAS